MKQLGELCIDDTPVYVQYFMDQYINPSETLPHISRSTYKCHSPAAALRILELIQEPEDLQRLVRFKFEHELVEAAMIHSGILRHESCDNTCYKLSSWKWYKDVGSEQQLAYEDEVAPLEYPRIERSEWFEGRYLQRAVRSLEQGVLYRSESRDFGLERQVFVSHVDKKVYYFQAIVPPLGVSMFCEPSTPPPLKHHMFDIPTVKKVMDGLDLFGPEGEGYKVVIVGVHDMSGKNPTGMGFTDSKSTMSLSEWQNQDEDRKYSSRVETVIARGRFFSVAEAFTVRRRKQYQRQKKITNSSKVSTGANQ